MLSEFLSEIPATESNIAECVSVENSESKGTEENSGTAPEEDNLLADFFTEVTSAPPDETKKPQLEEVLETQKILTEKYANQDLGTSREQYDRLLGKHYQWKNLNPYYVFQLDIDATEEDIKQRYKKLSLKVHPDRLRNVENANEAFEQVITSLFVVSLFQMRN